jgi:L-2-hydroxyglutarate oxidase
MNTEFDIIIVGGGLVGLGSAYKIQKKYPKKNLLILEKEKELAFHQSGRNSGVLHSGLYYTPGSYRAKNCVNGRRELVDFAKKYNINHDVCGKLVVATNEAELNRLPALLQKGTLNGLKGLKIINSDEIKKIEPFVEGLGAIHVPETGIIDYKQVANRLAKLVIDINPNSKILTNSEVVSCESNSIHSIVTIKNKVFKCSHVVFCCGLFSDRLAKIDKCKTDLKIVGFRGDYFCLKESSNDKVNHLIYPVPNPEFPFLGVHFTRMTTGEIECGPNAVFTFKREGYNKLDFSLKDTIDSLGYIGTWILFMKHWRFGLNEIIKASSKRIFLKHLQKMIPSLRMQDIIPGRSGVRAMALGIDGDIIDDFRIVVNKRNIHVLNAPSPAATACLSIGEAISESFSKIVD